MRKLRKTFAVGPRSGAGRLGSCRRGNQLPDGASLSLADSQAYQCHGRAGMVRGVGFLPTFRACNSHVGPAFRIGPGRGRRGSGPPRRPRSLGFKRHGVKIDISVRRNGPPSFNSTRGTGRELVMCITLPPLRPHTQRWVPGCRVRAVQTGSCPRHKAPTMRSSPPLPAALCSPPPPRRLRPELGPESFHVARH